MIHEEHITLEDIFFGFLQYEAQLSFNLALTEREGERQELEELQDRLIYFANAIPDYLSEKHQYYPSTIVVEATEDTSNKNFLDSLSIFLEAIDNYAAENKDNVLLSMVEDLLGSVNQTLLSSSLEFLN